MQFIKDFMSNVLARIQDAREEAGQTLVEYGLILALISIVAIVAMGLLGEEVVAVFEEVTDALAGGGGS